MNKESNTMQDIKLYLRRFLFNVVFMFIANYFLIEFSSLNIVLLTLTEGIVMTAIQSMGNKNRIRNVRRKPSQGNMVAYLTRFVLILVMLLILFLWIGHKPFLESFIIALGLSIALTWVSYFINYSPQSYKSNFESE